MIRLINLFKGYEAHRKEELQSCWLNKETDTDAWLLKLNHRNENMQEKHLCQQYSLHQTAVYRIKTQTMHSEYSPASLPVDGYKLNSRTRYRSGKQQMKMSPRSVLQ